jgi:(1->4)-alpha-D-glucan 1-alpha-D-glucosylmutase
MFTFVERLLLKQTPATSSEECEEQARFIGKLQQITSPVAAKGTEDTAMYRYNRLISLNEVGADPTEFGLEPAAVHAWMAARNRRSPSALSTTTTHDTKRGEDVRARLNILSEIPDDWKNALTRWRSVNRRFKTEIGRSFAPDANEEYLIYQTLVGAWPFETSAEADASFRDRMVAYAIKALREAKLNTTWLSPDEDYERAVEHFVRAILERRRPNLFLESFEPFQARVARLGIYNSLSQTLIKITAPGVPDFYQGAELWDLRLVDPDNRRPVDYGARREALGGLEGADPASLLASRTDGRVKMFVINRALATRRQYRDVFEDGAYEPIKTRGARADCVFAFSRGTADRIITCVPRLVATLVPDGQTLPLGAGVWGDTRIELPDGRTYRDVFTGALWQPVHDGRTYALDAASIFGRFPIALLAPSDVPGLPALPA